MEGNQTLVTVSKRIMFYLQERDIYSKKSVYGIPDTLELMSMARTEDIELFRDHIEFVNQYLLSLRRIALANGRRKRNAKLRAS